MIVITIPCPPTEVDQRVDPLGVGVNIPIGFLCVIAQNGFTVLNRMPRDCTELPRFEVTLG